MNSAQILAESAKVVGWFVSKGYQPMPGAAGRTIPVAIRSWRKPTVCIATYSDIELVDYIVQNGNEEDFTLTSGITVSKLASSDRNIIKRALLSCIDRPTWKKVWGLHAIVRGHCRPRPAIQFNGTSGSTTASFSYNITSGTSTTSTNFYMSSIE